MVGPSMRQRSLRICHLHMGGPDDAALEWSALLSSRFAPRLEQMGVSHTSDTAEADVIVVTGLLTEANVDAVLEVLSRAPDPSIIVAAGSAATNGGSWARAGMPGPPAFPLSHYADIQVTVPGDPPTPQALIAAISAAAQALGNPAGAIPPWQD